MTQSAWITPGIGIGETTASKTINHSSAKEPVHYPNKISLFN
jgi:hypothetical protein